MVENESKPKGNWKKEGWGKKPDTDTMIVTRIPPQNIDAEKSVLGAMLLDKDAIMTAEDKLTAADFYREANAIVFQAILNLAHKHVAFFSLEMSREQLVQRLLCSTALVDSAKLRTGRISTQKEWDQLASAASVLMDAPLFIDDTPGVSVSEIRSKCRRLKAEQGLDIIMIDYLQLMQAKNTLRNGDNRQQEISEISRSLKSLARELNVPVIALSQLSRSVEARQDHRPLLSDLRESGSLEQDADMVSFLFRPAYYDRDMEDDNPQKNETEIILAKNRNGPVDTVKLLFAGQFTLFYELTNQEPPPDMM